MTAVDWIIVAFTLLMASWGYAQGLIVGALSLGVSAVATLYPSASAAKVLPAEALRYE